MAIQLNFQAAPVSQFAKEDPYRKGQIELQKGKVAQRWVAAAQDARAFYEELRDERELLNTVSKIETAESIQAEERDKVNYYSGEELAGTGYKGLLAEKGPDGEDVPRDIPAWEAEPYIRKKASLDNLENAASGITNKRLRYKFLSKSKEVIENSFQNAITKSKEYAYEFTRAEIGETISELLRTGGHDQAIDVMEQSNLFTKEEKEEAYQNIQVNKEYFDAYEHLTKTDLTIADRKDILNNIDRLSNEKYSGKLDQKQRTELISKLQAKLKSDIAGKSNKMTLAQRRRAIALREEIDKGAGNVTEGLLAHEAKQGFIADSHYTELAKHALSADQKKREELKLVSRMKMSIDAGYKMERNAETQKAVDSMYQAKLNEHAEEVGLENVNPETVIQIGLAATRSTGIMPTEVADQFRAANAGNATQLISAAMLYNEYQEKVPEAMDVFNSEIKTVQSVATRMKLGMTPEEAVESSARARDRSPQEREIYKQIEKEWLNSSKGAVPRLDERLDALIGASPQWDVPWRKGSVDLPPFARSYFKSMWKANLDLEGDPEIAANMALDEFNRMFAMSDVNNPEGSKLWVGKDGWQVFSPAIDPVAAPYMQDAVTREFAGKMKEGSRIEIQSNAYTVSNSRPDQPFYNVVAYDADGTPQPLGFYAPDMERIALSVHMNASEQRIKDAELQLKRHQNIMKTRKGAYGLGENDLELEMQHKETVQYFKEQHAELEREWSGE